MLLPLEGVDSPTEGLATVKKLVVLLIVIAAGLAAGAYWINNSRRAAAGEDGYTFGSTEFGSMTEAVSANGVLKPRDIVLVNSKIAGEVVEIGPSATFNKVVEEGDPLLKLEDSLVRERLEQAKDEVQQAEADVSVRKDARDAAKVDVEHAEDLHKSNNINEAELRKARLKLKAADTAVHAAEIKVSQARKALEQAQLTLGWMTIRVPVTSSSGGQKKRKFVVIDRKVELGQQVGPQSPTPLFTLASDLTELELDAQVAEGDIGKVHPGLSTDFTVSTFSDTDVHFRGQVSEVRLAPTNVHGAVFYDAIIEVKNEQDPDTHEWRLRPGMTASVDIIRRKHENVWKVPTAALSFQPDERQLTDSARSKLARWQERNDRNDWKPVWVLDANKKLAPLFVRVNGKSARGETGIKDAQFTEVLEWDPEMQPAPDSKAPPRVVIAAPPTSKGFLNSPIKL